VCVVNSTQGEMIIVSLSQSDRVKLLCACCFFRNSGGFG